MSQTTPFQTILNKHRENSTSERNKGDRFENLIQAYLQTDPKYTFELEHVWIWNDFPFRNDFGGNDLGIDLVAKTITNEYWAIQCKCYQETAIIDKPAVDSFLSPSGKKFKENDNLIGFSNRIWVSTTNNWGTNAEETIRNQTPAVTRINLSDLENSSVDWEKLDQGIYGEKALVVKKKPFQHQKRAIEKTNAHFKSADRGKLIMACGTGKTFTSLKIAENETNHNGFILFLVPSIALLGQTLSEWVAQAEYPISPICICSDAEISRKKTTNEDSDGFSIIDLALPATTNIAENIKRITALRKVRNIGMTVIFSTYQSINVVSETQKALFESLPEDAVFDLIICDEAHRTTGVTLSGEDEAAFVKVHDNNFIEAKKRLYMTATPRLFAEEVKQKAAQREAELCSMDDVSKYGEEMYRIGFGEAVEKNLLADYKVLILTLSENDVPKAVQEMIADDSNEITTDDISKLIGCVNALSKKILGDNGIIKETDPNPMQRAVAFCQSIKISKRITETFNTASDTYINALALPDQNDMVQVASQHIDGTMAAPKREELLNWLKKGGENEGEARILTNVRCLSEGVDVPSLDAVLFLSARNSQVDVVQSVGRVMRTSPGKKYGYIIIPVIVPSNVEANHALDDNERYKVVWSVLNALRAHDDRFNATINKIELNNKRPDQIIVGGVGAQQDGNNNVVGEKPDPAQQQAEKAKFINQLSMQFEELQSVVFAKLVQKVGDRRYWEQWAKDVAQIAERFIERINRLINESIEHRNAFDLFLAGLQKNINPSITEAEAVEMLSQHIITKPVFEALFEGYSFVKNNPISVSMQTMLDLLEDQSIDADTETLQKFYESVKTRASGIDNAAGKQKIVVELYDKFFKSAFPKMVEKLGIVYTPIEVVDFMIHSVEAILQKEFGRSISDENIHLLDPFTGTGTFMTRLLQSGLIKKEDLQRKYSHELHANEIVLLAYYIAAINIENTYHDLLGAAKYQPFDGICLTDTFQLGESDASEKMFSEMFPQNSERVLAQKKAPLRVIMGNPPYSVGQNSANDNAQNQSYPKLDSRIEATYARGSNASSVKALYDSYIKAFRWSSDRLDKNEGGMIAFVSNGAWLDGNGADGFRKCLENEFSAIYVFNLRGNQRTSGELSRKEGGKIFGSGSRTPIAITFLVKNPNIKLQKATINYKDIGDYLNREEKLNIINNFGSVEHKDFDWQILNPNEFGDWISVRNDVFSTFLSMDSEKKYDINSKSFFLTHSLGTATARDAWVYNFSSVEVKSNMENLFEFYNNQRILYSIALKENPKLNFDFFASNDSTKISWNDSLKNSCSKNVQLNYLNAELRTGVYRPFNKLFLYFDRNVIQRPYQLPKFLPNNSYKNLMICVTGIGASKDFSCLISDYLPGLDTLEKAQCFPLYYYEENKKEQISLFDNNEEEFVRRDGISDFILAEAQKAYGNVVGKEDIFYYVYGFLHSPSYRIAFAADLKKMLPRIPLVETAKDFWAFSKAGRKLAELHINYETVPPAEGVIVKGAESGNFLVGKMRFPSKEDKSKIFYNSQITIENIPAEAYEYIVNGKSAMEWIMERYQITINKDSQICNNPNHWSEEVGNPRYILDLLLSIIRVSVETVGIVKGLPEVNF